MGNPKHGSQTPKKAASKPKKDRDVKFVNYSLTKEDKDRCRAWLTTLDELDSAALRLIEEGYKWSAKWDDYSGAHAAFLMPVDPDGQNAGYMLAGRGSTPLKALKQVMFIHWVAFDGEWGAHYTERRNEELDD